MNGKQEQNSILKEQLYAVKLEKAKNTALKYVSARMRTKQETITYLQAKNFSAELVQDTIAFLLQYQYLDDDAYCRAWIHDRIQFHPCGRLKMAAELLKKGLDIQFVQTSLETYFPLEEELKLAETAVRQKQNSSTGKKMTRNEMARFLYNRGYSSDVIAHMLRIEPEEDPYDDSYDDSYDDQTE